MSGRLALVLLTLVFLPTLSSAEEPILARLALWVPADRMTEFEDTYRAKLLPILEKHGLVPSSVPGRATVDSAFTRLFELQYAEQVGEIWEAVNQDTAWHRTLREVEAELGHALVDSLNRTFHPYRIPAYQGRVVAAGPGKTVPARRGKGHWRNYSPLDGLGSGKVRTILQDREGYLWFGTGGGGVSRFDGHRFTAFTTHDGLGGNAVLSALEDRDGNLWFGFDRNGVSRYDGEEFTSFTTADGLAHRRVVSMAQTRNGDIWCGGPGGVSRYENGVWTIFDAEDGLPGRTVYPLLPDRDGGVWLGSWKHGVARYDGTSWTSITARDGLADNGIRSIFPDRDGCLWFCTLEGVTRYDGKSFTTLTVSDGLVGRSVKSACQDHEGRLWFGVGGGVSCYDGESFTNYTTEDGLAGRSVWPSLVDREGNLWFGTDGDGASRYDGASFVTFGPDQGLPGAAVGTVFEDRSEHLWFGTSVGLCRYDGETFTTFTSADGLAGDLVGAIWQDRKGNIWFGTGSNSTKGQGVSRYDGERFVTFTADAVLAGNRVLSITQGRSGCLWFGTRGGLTRYDGGTWETFTKVDGMGSGFVRSVIEDRGGVLWVGGRGGGVSRFDPTVGMGPDAWKRYGMDDGLASGNVWSAVEDREGKLWFATSDGLSRYDPAADGRPDAWMTYTTSDGLPEIQIRGAHMDRDGDLWFATLGGGVARYDGRVFQTLDTRDGLAGNAGYCVLQDRNGDYWISSFSGGVTRYRPAHPSPPPVYVDAVVADRRYESVADVSVPSTSELIAIEFHALSLKSRPDGILYRFRLIGHDPDWRTTRKRRVEYESVGTGTYRFEVEAVDRDMVYSKAPAVVELTVHLPYGQIGLAIGLAVAGALAVWQTVRIVRRDRRLQESNAAMSTANKELFRLNQALQRDRAVERIRGEVQAMDEVADFERVLSLVSADLKTVGLSFDTCSIDVLDEPVDVPTMAHFEEHGFRYTSYELDPDGDLASESYALSAPFPLVNREMIERFIAGEPWQVLIGGQNAIAEVPISRYGRLRLSASGRESYTDAEIATLEEFAGAIALGYARYMDILEIQEQTARKSAFLASMSHELRTPMNAIKGFTGLVLRRIGDSIPERHQGNLEKVIQASDHLLAMINDLLDLSKIEAGRMDVNAERFEVKALVASCCDTVSPLLAEKPEPELSYEVGKEVGDVETDQARVRQMVINLLSNAIKFTERGEVRVRVRRTQDTEHRMQEKSRTDDRPRTTDDGRQDQDQLKIVVADTGKGIPEDELDTIFDEYRQVKGSDAERRGTGLGLSITRKFAELLGGTISVESQEGKGSTFTVTIPATYRSP